MVPINTRRLEIFFIRATLVLIKRNVNKQTN